MPPTFLLFLAGLTALGFLTVIWRRRQMPAPLLGLLVIAAAAVVVFVGWTLTAGWLH